MLYAVERAAVLQGEIGDAPRAARMQQPRRRQVPRLEILPHEGEEGVRRLATLPGRQPVGVVDALALRALKEIVRNGRANEAVLVHAHDELVPLARHDAPDPDGVEPDHVAVAGREGGHPPAVLWRRVRRDHPVGLVEQLEARVRVAAQREHVVLHRRV